jgi:excisionase family DNA binding protein
MTENSAHPLLTPAEVARLFRVDPKTVTRWATTGRLRSLRTPGGHRRFRESDVRALLADSPPPRRIHRTTTTNPPTARSKPAHPLYSQATDAIIRRVPGSATVLTMLLPCSSADLIVSSCDD